MPRRCMRPIIAVGLAAVGTIAGARPSLAQFSPGYSPPVMPSWYDYGILRQQTINGADGEPEREDLLPEDLLQDDELPTEDLENPSMTDLGTSSVSVNLPPEAIPLLQQPGVLQAGDAIIPLDGSFYDQYTFAGQAGQTVMVWMQSHEFDTYLAVLDADGRLLAENDDLSDSTTDSAIRLTLAENGLYTVIANTSTRGETGQYVVGVAAW